MNGILPPALAETEPLTRQEQLERLRSAFHAELTNYELFMYVVGAVALLGLLLLAIRLVERARQRRATRPDYLIRGARVLRLSLQERADLARLATRAQLVEPAAMLLSPANLAYALKRAFPDTGEAELRRRVNSLCLKLFGAPLPTAVPQPGPHR